MDSRLRGNDRNSPRYVISAQAEIVRFKCAIDNLRVYPNPAQGWDNGRERPCGNRFNNRLDQGTLARPSIRLDSCLGSLRSPVYNPKHF